MKNSTDDSVNVAHIARLAMLELDDEEISRFQREIESILDYAKMLSEVNIDNIAPTAHASAIENVFREDNVGETLDRNEVLANAPDTLDDLYFKVPVVIQAEGRGEG